MGWKGRCISGVYLGTRKFLRSDFIVRGVFGLTGIVPDCGACVTARCQLFLQGRLLPFWWLACSDPLHRLNAGVIEHLDEQGNVIRIERFLVEPRAEALEVPAECVEGVHVAEIVGKKPRKRRTPPGKPIQPMKMKP
jgi:hypothetical protein